MLLLSLFSSILSSSDDPPTDDDDGEYCKPDSSWNATGELSLPLRMSEAVSGVSLQNVVRTWMQRMLVEEEDISPGLHTFCVLMMKLSRYPPSSSSNLLSFSPVAACIRWMSLHASSLPSSLNFSR